MAGKQSSSKNGQTALIGAGVAVAAGTAAFLLSRRTGSGGVPIKSISDAPDHVWRRGTQRYTPNQLGHTLLIGKTALELYDKWRDFAHFPEFMENVERVEKLDENRSRWTIKAPVGTSVELVTRITDDETGKSISWESEPESQIMTKGRVEFNDATAGRGTMVRLTMFYSPPGGIVGKGIAKLAQREPHIQARRDLHRFKSLMETGEVATNASPSARKSDSPTNPRI